MCLVTIEMSSQFIMSSVSIRLIVARRQVHIDCDFLQHTLKFLWKCKISRFLRLSAFSRSIQVA